MWSLLQRWIICRQMLFPRFAACSGADGFWGSRARWFSAFNHISFAKIPPLPKVWWRKPQSFPWMLSCFQGNQQEWCSGTPETAFPLLCSKRELGWRLSHQCPHRSCHLPPQILHPKFGTAGTGRGKHVKDPEVKSYRERLHPGR